MFEWLVSFVTWSPIVSIILFSLIISILLSWIYKLLIDQNKFKALKERQNQLRKDMKEFSKEPEKLAEIQKEMMKSSSEMMRLTMKPMLITFIPLLLTFAGLKWLYIDAAHIGNIVTWGANLPIVGNGGGWLFFYIVFSFIFSMITRKIFGVS